MQYGLKAGPLSAQYRRGAGKREPYLERGRDCARLTLPSVLPDEGHNAHTTLETPYQSVGAEGVTNLTAKLSLALFPASSSFFRLRIDEQQLDLEEQALLQDPDVSAEVEASLAQIEKSIMDEFELAAWRPRLTQTLRSLVVTGNALLWVEGRMLKNYALSHYVTERDGRGHPVSITAHEKVAWGTLPGATQEKVKLNNPSCQHEAHNEVSMYTAADKLEDGRWMLRQEIGGTEIYSKTVAEAKCPFIPLTWNRVDGEDYGRGKVDEVLGSLQSLEVLSEASLKAASLASKHVLLNGVNSGVSDRRLQNSRDGDIISGVTDLASIKFLTVEKGADLQILLNRIDALEKQLQRAFLDFEAVRRQAERVTAEEIRTIALQLEETLGGVYSSLTQELQLPLVERLMESVDLPTDTKKNIRPVIIAGLDALGRGHDFQRISTFVQAIGGTFGPEALTYLNTTHLLKRTAVSLGLDPAEVIKSEEQLAQEQQQQQMMALAQQAAGPAVTAMANATQQPPTGEPS